MITTNLAIIEDEPSELAALRAVVESWPGFHCCGAYRTAEGAIKDFPLTKPDIAVVDLGLPRMDGIRCIWKLKQACPSCEILVHSVETQARKVLQAIQAGATGYLVKGASPQQIFAAVQTVISGGSVASPSIARLMFQRLQAGPARPVSAGPLSQRETEVLRLLVEGYTNDEAADELAIARDTVKTHVRHIYETLQVHSRAEVIAWWHERNERSG